MICMYAQLLLFVKLNYIAQFHGELMCAEYYLLVVFQEWWVAGKRHMIVTCSAMAAMQNAMHPFQPRFVSTRGTRLDASRTSMTQHVELGWILAEPPWLNTWNSAGYLRNLHDSTRGTWLDASGNLHDSTPIALYTTALPHTCACIQWTFSTPTLKGARKKFTLGEVVRLEYFNMVTVPHKMVRK
jgi:hypothetical protein